MNRTSMISVKSRGVATLMAIVILGLLAVVLFAVSRRVAADAVRATIAGEEIQASRLLAAGKECARAQLGSTPTDGPVPTPLGTITLAWQGEGAAKQCVVVAQVGDVRREVKLSFDGTRVTKAE